MNSENEAPDAQPPADKTLQAPDFFICTSPEMDALERAAADGKHGLHYSNLEQELARVHQIEGASHFVRLELSSDEQMGGMNLGALEQLSNAQDADATLAFLYVSRLLAPPAPLQPREYSGGKVDFDDVISKIGWDPRSSVERREMHERLYKFILFGERAQVVGTRRGKYRDKHTGKDIPTTIRSALWRVVKTETPDQQALFPDPQTKIPVRVELVISREWAQLLTQPQTAQYLPMGELLGAIPGAKPSGAWARVIGLSLASFWRRLPRESQDGSVKPTRRELLERYTPKTGSVADVLATHNPQNLLVFWCGALRLLSECGFVKEHGEVLIPLADMRAKLPRQNWADGWLDEHVDIQPGPVLVEAMRQRVAALPPPPAPAPPKRKPGRPRKVRE